VDAAMVDGAALLTTMMHGMMAMGIWNVERGTNMLDTGAFFYEVYRTKDDKFVSVGSIEPQFYAALVEHTGLGEGTPPPQYDRASWRSEEHTSELQSRENLVCRLLLEKKKKKKKEEEARVHKKHHTAEKGTQKGDTDVCE